MRAVGSVLVQPHTAQTNRDIVTVVFIVVQRAVVERQVGVLVEDITAQQVTVHGTQGVVEVMILDLDLDQLLLLYLLVMETRKQLIHMRNVILLVNTLINLVR